MNNLVLEVILVFVLILFNGLFAMSEIAVVSARLSRLQQMANEGDQGAQTALELAGNPNRFLSTVQVGITLIGILAGAFGGATVARELTTLLARVPGLASYASTISFVLVVGTITYLSVVIGELVPKRIALYNAERIASLIARPMRGLSVVATPIVRLLSLTTEAVVRLLGVEGAASDEVTEEEITLLVEQGARTGIIEEAERDMVESIFRLGDRSLEALMTSRPEIVWLDVNASQEEIRNTVEASGHTRFPVCDGELDHVLGVLLAKKLVADCLSGRDIDLRASMQEPLFAPESMRALPALERFKQTGMHMMLVVDEYGGIEGLVTLIDLLEAIVGDIPTPAEIAEPPIVQRADGSWLVDGLINIDEFQEAFDIGALPGEGRYHTLGGFVVYMLGRLPVAGDLFGWGGYRFEVADMDGKRVDKVLLDAAPPAEEEARETGRNAG
jgi:putative hemolysin